MTTRSEPRSAESNDSVLLREDHGPITVLTMNRGETRNALSEDLVAALREHFEDLSRSQSIKAVIIAANGPAFCAGHDMRELESHRQDDDGGKNYFARTFSASSTLMLEIMACPKPVIAAVGGTATAAGCQLVATCDLAVASEDAQFCTPGVHIGLFCTNPMVALTRNVGPKQAMEMLLLGEMIGAKQACDFGLVNRVVPNAQVLPVAMEMAQSIAAKSAAVIALGKKTYYAQQGLPAREAYDKAARAMAENMLFADAEEGLTAFLEKRKPLWRDA